MKDTSLDSTDLTWLAGLARALLGEPHAADDLVQETAVAALRGSPPLGAPRRAWLGAVARRLAARRFRGDARRERREELAARPEALPDSTELVEKAEIAEQVTAAARALPEPYRRTILLRFLEGRTAEEIAREEGKPTDTVRWRVRRGLELLREELVRKHDRDWSSWSVLLIPLARSNGGVGLATAGAAGGVSGTVASLTVMKVTMTVAAAVGCAGMWLAWGGGDEWVGGTSVEMESVANEAGPERPTPELVPGRPAVEPATKRAEGTTSIAVDEPALEVPAVVNDLVGDVVDENGQPVEGATVYLIPSAGSEGELEATVLRTLTESDGRGEFRIAREDWLSDETGETTDAPALDLGVVANGFRRRFVPDVTNEQAGERLLVVLEQGRTLTGRVVDELGRPVPDLELLAHPAYAGIDHVSPSQRMLYAQRKVIGDTSSAYDHCRATTDGRGDITFTGLPPGELRVLPLDPGWTIEEPGLVEEGDTYVEWTAKRRLGVRLIVTDARTGQPVERASATFCFKATFANGETMDLSQWVGRGRGEVSFVLGPDLLPGLEDRTMTRVDFYGTVRSGDGKKVNWTAEPIEDLTGTTGAVGVAEVRVEVDPVSPMLASDPNSEEAPAIATIELDVRYADAVPFEGELTVWWVTRNGAGDRDRDIAETVGLGRYRVDVPAGDLVLEVADRYGSGSFPRWTEEVRCAPGQTTTIYPTLPRGASATITRPEGWTGEWFLHATWRPVGTDEWQGGLGYSTDGSSMTLTVLRPAEWRFALRRFSALEPDPLVRTVVLEEGDSAVVDE